MGLSADSDAARHCAYTPAEWSFASGSMELFADIAQTAPYTSQEGSKVMAISRKISRLSRRQAETQRSQLRQDQYFRDEVRKRKQKKIVRRSNLIESFQGIVVLLLIVGFFAMIYWLAVSDSVPAAF